MTIYKVLVMDHGQEQLVEVIRSLLSCPFNFRHFQKGTGFSPKIYLRNLEVRFLQGCELLMAQPDDPLVFYLLVLSVLICFDDIAGLQKRLKGCALIFISTGNSLFWLSNSPW